MKRAILYKIWAKIEPYKIEHKDLHNGIKKHAKHMKGIILDAGCGGSPYKELLHGSYIGVDIKAGDIRASLLNIPIKDSSVDSVLCTQVLEHVPEPYIALKEFYRIMGKKSYLLLTVPMVWGLHEIPHDYYRYTRYGLKYLLEKSGFRVISIHERGGLFKMMAQRFNAFLYYGLFLRLGKLKYVIGSPLILFWNLVTFTGIALNKLYPKGDTLGYVCLGRKE